MKITDTDIERAIQKNLAKLDMLTDQPMPIGMDVEDSGSIGDKNSKD